jgi:hypothetical protein
MAGFGDFKTPKATARKDEDEDEQPLTDAEEEERKTKIREEQQNIERVEIQAASDILGVWEAQQAAADQRLLESLSREYSVVRDLRTHATDLEGQVTQLQSDLDACEAQLPLAARNAGEARRAARTKGKK